MMIELHSHKCDHCGLVWSHGSDLFGDLAAHTCAHCGYEQWKKLEPPYDLSTAIAVYLSRNRAAVADEDREGRAYTAEFYDFEK